MSVNNVKVTDEDAALTAEQFLTGRMALLRRAGKNSRAVRVA